MINKSFNIKEFLLKYIVFIFMGIVFITYSITISNFLTVFNIFNTLLANANPLLIVSIGATLVIITGDLDLSVGSVMAIAGAIWVALVGIEVNMWLAMLAGILGAFAVGSLNAFLIVKLKINAFLCTMGTMIAGRGLVYIITNSRQFFLSDEITSINTVKIGGISLIIFSGILLMLIMQLIMKYTSFGRNVMALGCNKTAAVRMGINVKKTRFAIFSLSGLFSGIAGIVAVLNLGCMAPAFCGQNMEFNAIAAILLGGTSLLGGRGTIVPGTLVGVIFFQLMENGLALMGANPYLYPFVRGILLLLAMYMDSLRNNSKKLISVRIGI